MMTAREKETGEAPSTVHSECAAVLFVLGLLFRNLTLRFELFCLKSQILFFQIRNRLKCLAPFEKESPDGTKGGHQ